MATVNQAYKGITVEPDKVTTIWLIEDTDDPAVALAALLATAPDTYFGYYRRAPTLRERGPRNWLATVTYTAAQPDDPDDPTPTLLDFSYEITTESKNLKYSLNTAAKYPGTAPDFQRALNVSTTPHGVTVAGADIPWPTATFSISLKGSAVFFTDAYLRGIEELIPSVNAATFLGRAAGEVMLAGATGHAAFDRGFDFELILRFNRRPNETGIEIGPYTINKTGWQYVWPLTELKEEDDGGAKALAPQIAAVYVEDVIPPKSWAPLGSWAV